MATLSQGRSFFGAGLGAALGGVGAGLGGMATAHMHQDNPFVGQQRAQQLENQAMANYATDNTMWVDSGTASTTLDWDDSAMINIQQQNIPNPYKDPSAKESFRDRLWSEITDWHGDPLGLAA